MTSTDNPTIEVVHSIGRSRTTNRRHLQAVAGGLMPLEVPHQITDGLYDAVQRRRLVPTPTAEDPAEVWAAWSAQLAVSHARAAGWWGALNRWTVQQTDLPLLFTRAIRTAQRAERGKAKEWAEAARTWQGRAVQPTATDQSAATTSGGAQ